MSIDVRPNCRSIDPYHDGDVISADPAEDLPRCDALEAPGLAVARKSIAPALPPTPNAGDDAAARDLRRVLSRARSQQLVSQRPQAAGTAVAVAANALLERIGRVTTQKELAAEHSGLLLSPAELRAVVADAPLQSIIADVVMADRNALVDEAVRRQISTIGWRAGRLQAGDATTNAFPWLRPPGQRLPVHVGPGVAPSYVPRTFCEPGSDEMDRARRDGPGHGKLFAASPRSGIAGSRELPEWLPRDPIEAQVVGTELVLRDTTGRSLAISICSQGQLVELQPGSGSVELAALGLNELSRLHDLVADSNAEYREEFAGVLYWLAYYRARSWFADHVSTLAGAATIGHSTERPFTAAELATFRRDLEGLLPGAMRLVRAQLEGDRRHYTEERGDHTDATKNRRALIRIADEVMDEKG